MPINKSELFKKAWKISKDAAIQYNDIATIFFSESLKQAWRKMKNQILKPNTKQKNIDEDEMEMKNLVGKSLNFITKNLKDKGTIFLGFSGGKDSIVIADLMKRSGIPFKMYYSVTGIDPPDVVKFIRKTYPECIFLRPNKTFWHSMTTKNPPANFSRWC